jgi:hypothetical protein
MTYNRLGALLAGIFGLGWLLAIGVSLLVWTPQTLPMGVGLWYDSAVFLSFVAQNSVSWQVFHYSANLGLLALTMLIPLLQGLFLSDPRHRALSTAGIVGAVLLLLASFIDQFGSPALARHLSDNPVAALQIWEWMEPWRDLGLKTASYWLLGFWLLWLGGRFLTLEGMERFGRFSQIAAGGLFFLAVVKTFVPAPLIYYLSETGGGGAVLLLFPVWGFWLAHWFWRRPAMSRSDRFANGVR